MTYLYGHMIAENQALYRNCKFVMESDAINAVNRLERDRKDLFTLLKIALVRLKELVICGNTEKNKEVVAALEAALTKE
jgi:hypothetical protein